MHFITKKLPSVLLLVLCLAAPAVYAQTKDLGKGFKDHGVATPVSTTAAPSPRSTARAARRPVLALRPDRRLRHARLNAETGKGEQIPIAFPPGRRLSLRLDPLQRQQVLHPLQQLLLGVRPGQARLHLLREDDAADGHEHDRGRQRPHLVGQLSPERPGLLRPQDAASSRTTATSTRRTGRSIRAPSPPTTPAGSISASATRPARSSPSTRRPARPRRSSRRKRSHGLALVYRDIDGKVYGQADRRTRRTTGTSSTRARPRSIGTHDPSGTPRPVITGRQACSSAIFPTASASRTCDLIEGRSWSRTRRPNAVKEFHFDYTSEGAHIMGVAPAPDKTICGGTAFPMRFFSYDPAADKWINREAYVQWNTVGQAGGPVFRRRLHRRLPAGVGSVQTLGQHGGGQAELQPPLPDRVRPHDQPPSPAPAHAPTASSSS